MRVCLLLFLQQSMRYVYEAWNYLYYLNLIIRQMYRSSTSHSYPCDQDMCVLSAGNINQERTMYTQFASASFSGNNQQPPLRQKAFPEDQQSAGVRWLLLRPSTSPGSLLIPRGKKKIFWHHDYYFVLVSLPRNGTQGCFDEHLEMLSGFTVHSFSLCLPFPYTALCCPTNFHSCSSLQMRTMHHLQQKQYMERIMLQPPTVTQKCPREGHETLNKIRTISCIQGQIGQ